MFKGRGDGRFETAQDFLVGGSPSSLVVGDFDADGDGDVAVARQFSGVVVFSNVGHLTFEEPVSYPIFRGSVSVTAADFDGNGGSKDLSMLLNSCPVLPEDVGDRSAGDLMSEILQSAFDSGVAPSRILTSYGSTSSEISRITRGRPGFLLEL